MSGEKLSELKQVIILYSQDTFATINSYVRSFALGQEIFADWYFKRCCFFRNYAVLYFSVGRLNIPLRLMRLNLT
jgi:hypothetical protein